MCNEQKDFIVELKELLKRHDVVLTFNHLIDELCVYDDNSFQENNPIVDCRKSKGRGRDGERICNTIT